MTTIRSSPWMAGKCVRISKMARQRWFRAMSTTITIEIDTNTLYGDRP